MAINPELITTIRVDQLPDETLSLTNLFPHTVGTDLKSATIQELVDLVATSIGVSGGVGYIAISVTDGQQLPDVPELPSFFLCGAGTFLNINGYPDVICTENLNAIMSLSDHWQLAVEIPINALSGTVQTVTGSAVDNTDPLNPVINEIIFGVQNIIAGTNITVDNTDPANPIVSATGGGGSQNLQQVTDEGNETTNPIKVYDSEKSFTLQSNGILFEDIDDGGNTLLRFENTSTPDEEVFIRGLGGTMALLSDITTSTLQDVTDEGNTITGDLSIITLGDDSVSVSSIIEPTKGASINSDGFFVNGDDSQTIYKSDSIYHVDETTTKNLQINYPTSIVGTNKVQTFQDADGTIALLSDITSGGVTSVGLTMPYAFTVTNSPITSSGDIAVTGAGLVSQYVRGDGTLANFPNSTGGGSSVNYYLNGSVSQGTFGGDTYYQMSKTPILGAGTNFTRTNGQGNGYIASFITDAGDPSFLNIPGGNWNVEFYLQSSATGGSPQFYAELYKVSETNTFTLVASGSANPEGITNGTTVDQYFTSIPVPQTSLLITDRLAIRIYVITSGRTITLHTENGNLCEVLTTFTTGLTALNGLTTQVQNLAVGTSGTDFAISSATDTHTFNLPTASASNRGALSSTDWSTFNNKQDALSYSPFKFVQTSQTAHTGTVAETVIATATINGDTFNSSDVMKILFKATKSNTSATTLRLKINTTNTLVGATQIGILNFTVLANTYALMTRTFDLNGGTLSGYNFSSSLVSDVTAVNTAGNSTTYNTANTLYLFFTLQLATISDTVTPNLCNITN